MALLEDKNGFQQLLHHILVHNAATGGGSYTAPVYKNSGNKHKEKEYLVSLL
jgi:hypothetical protein